jgi:hypothetical protein
MSRKPCGPQVFKQGPYSNPLSAAATVEIPELGHLRATVAQSALLKGQHGSKFFISFLLYLLYISKLFNNAATTS